MRQFITIFTLLFVFLIRMPTGMALPFQHLDFSLHKKGEQNSDAILLVVGGIQGDEPGGFNAASLLATEYEIERGAVWVVPNLNFKSIIHRSRGIYGDMNRKFLKIRDQDPDYEAIQKIKSIILDTRVAMILNLHDGSGFFRPHHIDRMRNPNRWGQSVIIDQAELPSAGQHSRLEDIAQRLSALANRNIGNRDHHFHVKNTYTNVGNDEMEKTLTYFAVRHHKPAFGIEASKAFLTHQRVYYHLRMLEATMDYMGIKYRRTFKLSQRALKQKIDNNIRLSIFQNKIFLDMANARRQIRFLPLQLNKPLEFISSSPLLAVINDQNHFRVQYGNRHVTRLLPQYFEYDDSLNGIYMTVDGKDRFVPFGSRVNVNEHFMVEELENYRVNVIGYYGKRDRDEAGELINYDNIVKQFSLDRDARRFRVEVYTGKRYCGMVIVDFEPERYTQELTQAADNNT